MSDMTSNSPHGLGYLHLTSKWGWFVALGVALVLFGIFALVDVVAFTIVSVIFIGAMLLVGGIFQIVHAFMTKTWASFGLNLLMGIIYVIGGFLIMQEPVQGSLVITLMVIAALAVGGIIRIMVGFRHREMASWWLLVLSGVISLILALMLYSTFPGSGLWVLGTLIAVELLIQGFTWLQFGLALRRLGRHAHAQ
jgi:uncharacterized membrane protein HdeD (DUF308 family)